jgi:hypothetical protein
MAADAMAINFITWQRQSLQHRNAKSVMLPNCPQ